MECPHYFFRIRRLVEQPSNHIRLSRNIKSEPFEYKGGKRMILQDALPLAMKAFAVFLGVIYLNNTP